MNMKVTFSGSESSNFFGWIKKNRPNTKSPHSLFLEDNSYIVWIGNDGTCMSAQSDLYEFKFIVFYKTTHIGHLMVQKEIWHLVLLIP